MTLSSEQSTAIIEVVLNETIKPALAAKSKLLPEISVKSENIIRAIITELNAKLLLTETSSYDEILAFAKSQVDIEKYL